MISEHATLIHCLLQKQRQGTFELSVDANTSMQEEHTIRASKAKAHMDSVLEVERGNSEFQIPVNSAKMQDFVQPLVLHQS